MSKQARAARDIAQRIADDPAADPELKMLAHAFLSEHVLITSLLPAIARTNPEARKALERELLSVIEDHAVHVLGAAAAEGGSRHSFSVDGPGLAELRAAFEAMPETFIAAAQHGRAIEALAAATRVVLGLEPPSIVEGPGIPELRIAIATMPPLLEYDAPVPLRRLIHAAQVVIGERNA